MIAFPNCKINVGLNVIRKREDNYHDIETVFYPVDLTDVLEIIPARDNRNETIITGLPAGDITNNLCTKAVNLLKKDYPHLPFIQMHLHKTIPVGAGLGGGSADAAFTLKILREKFLSGITDAQLSSYALKLGSDCPFFLSNQPSFAGGRGENLKSVQLDLSSYKIMLVNPGIHISTPWAFSKINPSNPVTPLREVITQPLVTWKKDLHNDFELPVFENYPEVKKIKETLYNSGAIYASLTGSGSTVYGIFNKSLAVNTAFPQTFFTRMINLK